MTIDEIIQSWLDKSFYQVRDQFRLFATQIFEACGQKPAGAWEQRVNFCREETTGVYGCLIGLFFCEPGKSHLRIHVHMGHPPDVSVPHIRLRAVSYCEIGLPEKGLVAENLLYKL